MTALAIKLNLFIQTTLRVFIISTLFLMLSSSLLIIIFRWFNISVMWPEPFSRHTVFLMTFLGASMAMAQRKHIAIDLLQIYLTSKNKHHLKNHFNRLTDIILAIILGYLCFASYKLFQIEADYARAQYWFIKSHHIMLIMPLGFLLMSFQSLLNFIISLKRE